MIQGITQYKQIIQKAKGRNCRTPPRTLHVLSWNCNGGNKAVLDAFIGTYKPDLVILQECNAQWYTTAPQGYSGNTISERHVWPLTGGQLVSDGNSSYCVLYTGLQVTDQLHVLDYRQQTNHATLQYIELFEVPGDIGQATSGGFAARIPAMMKFRNPQTMSTITLFNWHAHTSQDGIQAASFRFLEMSVELRIAVGEAGPQDLVIIAGDLNSTIGSLGNLTGINQNFDHIFANSGVHPYTDVVMETARIALITSSGDHTAVGGFIDY